MLFLIIVFLIITLDPIEQLFPIITFFSIIELCPIEQFFPIASHQVLIFSTDTEVDENFYPKLQPYITRSYSMIYDSKKGKTTKRDGYFWDEKGENVIEV